MQLHVTREYHRTTVCILLWQWGLPLLHQHPFSLAWRKCHGALIEEEGHFLPLPGPFSSPPVLLAPVAACVLSGEWVSPPLSFAPVSEFSKDRPLDGLVGDSWLVALLH